MAVRVLVGLRAGLAALGRDLRHRWRTLRSSGDRGVESVELAIGIALGLALALIVWAAYKTIVEQYLNQVE